MKFTLLQENFAKALTHVSKAVNSRPGLPILSNILIEVIDNKIKFSATDLELGIINWIPAEVSESGKLTVSARTLLDFISSLGAGKIEVYAEGNLLKVKSQNSNANFATMPADEFPEIPNETDEEILSINSKVFADILEKVVFAAATDDSRPVLTGILFESDGTKLSIVGVDGFRLSKYNITEVELNGKYKEVIPARTLSEVMKTLREDEEETVRIYRVKGNNQVLIKFKDIEFVSRLIEGEYPDYRQIMPTDHVLSFELNKDKLADAIKIINIFARDIVGNKTILSIDTLNMKAVLSASLAEVGGNDFTLDITGVEGTDMQIAFSAKYLSDMISHLSSDTLVFETNGVVAPGVFKEKGNEEFIHIIMPMRLD